MYIDFQLLLCYRFLLTLTQALFCLKGNYPIDHLIMWRYSKDYDDSMYPDYKHMKQRLKSQMESSK